MLNTSLVLLRNPTTPKDNQKNIKDSHEVISNIRDMLKKFVKNPSTSFRKAWDS